MKTPDHLKGLIGALIAVEKACEGTNYKWLITKSHNGYFASISPLRGVIGFTHHASTPGAALAHALAEFNVRIRKKP